uniref:Uncharacterized protein n=2 Tax=Magallana gigas TaxID=29159 RepID=A0A8W8I0Q3_MAGGI
MSLNHPLSKRIYKKIERKTRTRRIDQNETRMAENDENKTIRKVFTVVTSPLWVPVAAVGSLVAAPIQAVKDSKEVAEKTDSAGAGVSSYPGNAVVRLVTNPFKGVVKVGEALWGKDDK